MKNKFYFLFCLFMVLLVTFSPVYGQITDIPGIPTELNNIRVQCNNEIASSIKNASYPNGCIDSITKQPITCCSQPNHKFDTTVIFEDSSQAKSEVAVRWNIECDINKIISGEKPTNKVKLTLEVVSGCYSQVNTICGLIVGTGLVAATKECNLPEISICCTEYNTLLPPTTSPTPIPTSSPIPPASVVHVQDAIELDKQAIQKLKEEDYEAVPPLIDGAIESLSDARGNLKTDPKLEELRENKPKVVSKIDRLLESSINDHKKAASSIDRINSDPIVPEDEGLLSKLKNAAKNLLEKAKKSQKFAIKIFSTACACVRG